MLYRRESLKAYEVYSIFVQIVSVHHTPFVFGLDNAR